MDAARILERLKRRFGRGDHRQQSHQCRPWIEVVAARLAEVGRFLRDDPELRFDMLNCITAVDYLGAGCQGVGCQEVGQSGVAAAHRGALPPHQSGP